MDIDGPEVRHVADLAHLDLDEPTVERFRERLISILEYVSMLDEAPRAEPAADPAAGPRVEPRADEETPSLPVERALDGAPERVRELFRVPPVLDA